MSEKLSSGTKHSKQTSNLKLILENFEGPSLTGGPVKW